MKSPKFITSILIILFIVGCSISCRSFKSKNDGVYIPKNLTEAMNELDEAYADSIKLKIISSTEDDFLADSHFGIGLWIRNNWSLWGRSGLYGYFRRKGIMHPDDMSAIILTSYHRRLTGKEIELLEQIKYYKAYWKDVRETDKLVRLPSKAKHPESNLQFGYAMWYGNKQTNKNSMIHIQTNSKIDSVWIYDYLFGWEKISQEMEKELKSTYNPDSLMNVIFKEE